MNSVFPKLFELPKNVKYFLASFLILMTIGVTVGLVYVKLTTDMSAQGTLEHYAGSELADEFDILDKYPKEIESMLLTTHTHLISFSFIFFLLGGIFFMNSIITGGWKRFLIIEPFISVLITFGAIWGIRYSHYFFSTITILFGVLTYVTYYFMVGIILYEIFYKSVKD